MSRIRFIHIRNFRAIKDLEYAPSSGFNCFIGPGDSGKSSIIDAIDLCLGARRNAQFCDTDFHQLDVDKPIEILITLGALDDALKNLDNYGNYLRSFDKITGQIHDEPEAGFETVITLKLEVCSDLEPSWTLYSDRAVTQATTRGLQWADRVKLAPTRVGALAQHNLGWQRGSVLNRVSDERADASATLAKAARDARAAFGEEAAKQLGDALSIVGKTAKELGIPVGNSVKAMLDAHSVSFVGGTISLHDESGVPLRGLGIGSTRLLIAGLQRKASENTSVVLIDELEHGLEPHRIIRLLGSLGSKEATEPLQVFATTHSPIALRELSGSQLIVVRRNSASMRLLPIGTDDGVQGTIRTCPEAFLAGSVLICEGASEVGLVRGIDQYRTSKGLPSIFASGVALVDAGGVNKIYSRAPAFSGLGYRCAVLRDDDVAVDADVESAFTSAGGTVFKWDTGQALEQAIFAGVSDEAVHELIKMAAEDIEWNTINDHLKNFSSNTIDVNSFGGAITPEMRVCLGMASKNKKTPWFKTVTRMEAIGRDVIGPDLEKGDAFFKEKIDHLFTWASHVQP
ncbi:ATP-dependent nuclease [Methylorubrum sp. SL192]|uniref:ATP-dependent nuclease n=1 Tax=Methylorubrum sp. SL192 TaxID=2995167 RepID=UPI002274CB77|nr:ATP-binding protein [Methylorubrum sp. SL192]MCY1640668.1 AAA family ATPase [Methylorubrum sp. SL192]